MFGVATLTGAALGQNDNGPVVPRVLPAPRPSGLGGVPSQAPHPMQGLGGVRSQGPRPISGLGRPLSGLGGVRVQGPRPLGEFPSVLPTAPPTFSGRVQRTPALDRSPRFRLPSGTGFSRPVDLIGNGRSGNLDAFNGFRAGQLSGDGFFRPGATFVSPSGLLAVDASGLTVDGSVRGDRTNVTFHLGTGLFPFVAHGHHGSIIRNFPYYRSWPYWYGSGYGYGYGDGYYTPMYTETPSTYTPPPAAPAYQPPRALTPLERADEALSEGRSRDAVREYRAYLKASPEDAAAMRSLALALIQDKKIPGAVAVMAMAYERDTGLANQPMKPDILADGTSDLHTALLSVVAYANRVGTASSWLTVTVLMQAEGRDETAAKMLKRAMDQGLNAKVAGALELALHKP